MTKLTETIIALKTKLANTKHGHATWHLANIGGHVTYFGLVFLEGKGFYANAAGWMLGVTILGLFLYGEE